MYGGPPAVSHLSIFLLGLSIGSRSPPPSPGSYMYSFTRGRAFQWKYQQLSNDTYSQTGRTAPRTVLIYLSNVSITSREAVFWHSRGTTASTYPARSHVVLVGPWPR
ncbi:hypothetical protein EDD15DRAFT_1727433 [Pisolithus albus]|nr:hypothetical protein EDD15DRAFT_1727433 [Pisolithus albus]